MEKTRREIFEERRPRVKKSLEINTGEEKTGGKILGPGNDIK